MASITEWRRNMTSGTGSDKPVVVEREKEGSAVEKKTETEEEVSSYWGIRKPKISKKDGTEWPWNCFMVSKS